MKTLIEQLQGIAGNPFGHSHVVVADLIQQAIVDLKAAEANNKDAERWKKTMRLAGSYQDGSEQTLKFIQDDACRNYHIYVEKQHYYSDGSFESALDDIPEPW